MLAPFVTLAFIDEIITFVLLKNRINKFDVFLSLVVKATERKVFLKD